MVAIFVNSEETTFSLKRLFSRNVEILTERKQKIKLRMERRSMRENLLKQLKGLIF